MSTALNVQRRIIKRSESKQEHSCLVPLSVRLKQEDGARWDVLKVGADHESNLPLMKRKKDRRDWSCCF